jgi:hypothetical protein
MLTIIKLVAGAALAISIISPSSTPRADNCECKAKSSASSLTVPHADNCECKAKAN